MDPRRFDRLTRTLIAARAPRRALLGVVAGLLSVGALGGEAVDAKRHHHHHKTCKNGKTRCGNACVDTDTNPNNCGACGRACATDETCTNGTCTSTQICLLADAFCQNSSQCCPSQSQRICDVAVNASNSDRTCCGITNASCGAPNADGDDTAPFCCHNFTCDPQTLTCQPSHSDECTTNADCNEPQACVNTTCLGGQPCATSDDCIPNQVCSSGVCSAGGTCRPIWTATGPTSSASAGRA